RRRSLAALRREVEPVEVDAYSRFLVSWHNMPSERRGLEALVESIGMLQGAALVASSLETDVLPLRVRGYRSTDLDELCTSGELIWVGAGSIGATDGRIRLYFADQLPLLAPAIEVPEPPTGALHDAIRTQLSERGASFWAQVRAATPSATEGETLAALWDLVWAGEVTNDSLAPLRSVLHGARTKAPARNAPRTRPRPGRLTRIGPPAGAGRWSLVAPLLQPAPTPTIAAHAMAIQMMERYGVVTREAVLAEGVVGGYSGIYGVLKVLEERGQARRGYFVSGLGAAQFSLPGAVDRLRSMREMADFELHPEQLPMPIVLAATDPAQPYGAAIPWPESPGRPARSAGALVVLSIGRPLVWFDRRSHHLVTFPDAIQHGEWAEALATLVKDGRARGVEVRKVNGDPVSSAPEVVAVLKQHGFIDGYRGLIIKP
ncbi:MAG: putative ATP-dependent helicase, partial [Ilumatobacteraceae bacterium]|nr:putative ATP-dependent helicase [Ilumatobacteraceae bacterium]